MSSLTSLDTTLANKTEASSGGNLPLVFLMTTTFLYCLVFFLAIVGNGIVCYTIFSILRFSVTNLFLLNLAIGDLLLAITSVPFNLILDSWLSYWPYGEFMCKFLPFIQGTAVSTIATTQLVISFDRFILVYYPLRVRISMRSAGKVIISVWCTAIFMGLPMPLVCTTQMHPETQKIHCNENWPSSTVNFVYTTFMLVMQYFLPVLCMAISYALIVVKLWLRKVPTANIQNHRRRQAKHKEKLVKMALVVSTLYTISQLPRHGLFLASTVYPDFWQDKRMIWSLAVWFSVSSSCYNPFIYAWMNTKNRQLYTSLLLRRHTGRSTV